MTKQTKKSIQAHLDEINPPNLPPICNPLDTLKTLIFNTQELNQLKIEFLKEEIQAQKYEVNSNRIAAKLMEYSLTTCEETEMA